MSNKLLTVSPSPHVQGSENIQKLMFGVVIALIPTVAVSLFYFGIGSLIVMSVSVVACVAFEWLITKYLLKKEPHILDGSAIVTGLLLAFNVPSNLPVYIIVIGALVSIGIGKMTFGGLGNNVFNPALVGRVFLLISFPVEMTSWPKPIAARLQYTDAVTGATPLGILQEGVDAGTKVPEIMQKVPTHMDLFLGNTTGSAGEIAAVALLLGLIYMLWRKIITWHIPVITIGTVFVFTGIMWLADPSQFADPIFHLLTGGLMLGAIFMATDYVSSPMTRKGMLIYSIGIGVITVLIRTFGAYPEGISFAILIMNGFTPLINSYFKPKRFGEVQHGK